MWNPPQISIYLSCVLIGELVQLLVIVLLAGNNKIEGRWTTEDSDMLRGSLAKAIYEKMFLWIIQALNTTIEPRDGFQTFMGGCAVIRYSCLKCCPSAHGKQSTELLFVVLRIPQDS